MSSKHEQNAVDVRQKNVFYKPLIQLSHPSTSAPKDKLPSTITAGFCNPTSPIAATLTASFLDFSSKNGLDLRGAGVKENSRYCIDVGSWKKAVDSGIEGVPRVKLEATHEKALESVGIEELRKWRAEHDNESGVVWPRDGKSAGVLTRESGEIGGKEPKA